MTNEQARALCEQLASEPRIKAEIIRGSQGSKKGSTVKLLLKPGQRVIIIRQVEEWEGVKDVWGLSERNERG